MAFRKPELIPLLFIICATSLLGGLGVWQLQRLQWKEGLIAQVEKAQNLRPLDWPPQQNIADAEYRSITLSGRFLHDKELHKIGKYHDNQAGYHILTPFQPYMHLISKDDQITILVNRGWVPASMKERDKRPETVREDNGIVTGILVSFQKKNPFLPSNDVKHNVWLYDDLAQMSEVTGETLYPMVIVATGPQQADQYPVPSDGKISFRNDHLGYAITWFSLMMIGLIMFGFYHWVKD